MIPYSGDFAEDATVRFVFNTFSSDDPSASVTITDLADADLKVHKDGSTTEIVTDGATIAINFDGITGNHMVTIDTSAHADYTTGADYHVRMEGTTVDGATINAFIGHFSIENRFVEVDVTKWLGTAAATPTVAGVPEVDITHLMGTILAEGAGGRLAAAFNKLFDVTTPTLVASDVMRGTNSAATAGDLLDKLGAVNETAAAGDPSSTESVMQYVKQIVNILAGSDGVVTYPSEAAPANAVNLAEVIRAIHTDVTGIAGSAMRGTDSANTTTPPTVGAIADQVWDEDQVDHTSVGTFGIIATEIAAIPTTTMRGTDSAATAAALASLVTTVGAAGAGLTAINLPNQTMDISGNLSGSVGSVTGAVGSVAGNVDGTVASVVTKTGYSLISTGLDLVLIDGKTLPVATQIIAAACIGIISGAGTGTEVFKGLDKTTTRATVTVDGSGNRSAITYV